MRYSWLLFDADGTLFDYEQAEVTALATTFAQFGYPFEARHAVTYRAINGQMWRDFEQGKLSQQRLPTARFERLFAATGVTADTAVTAAFSLRYLNNLAQGTMLITGAEALVTALRPHYRLLLITNGLHEVQRPRLARSVLAGCFDAVVISSEVGVAKPDPAIFDVAFAHMGYPPKAETLIIGDSLTSDMRGGSDYGIDTCWFNPHAQPRPKDVTIRYEIRRLTELLDLLGVRL